MKSMSNKLAIRPQAAKEFDSRKQDHGTRGTDRYKVATKKSRVVLRKALEKVRPDLSIEDLDDRQDQYDLDRFVARARVMDTRLDLVDGFEEAKKELRQKALADRAVSTQEITAGLDDHYGYMTPAELEAEADRLLAEAEEPNEAESNQAIEESMYVLPTIEQAGGRSDKEIRKSMARAATLDTFEDDDFGDYNGDSHVRISNRPR